MSRVQFALNVDDLDEAITFYTKLFNIGPAKVKHGYANFAVAEPPLKLVLLENPGTGGTINHLGVEVVSSDTVHAEIARLTGEGLVTDEQIGTTCCFATQDKVWVTGPAGHKWEVYTVLADTDTFGSSPQHLDDGDAEGGWCWGGTGADAVTVSAGHVLLLTDRGVFGGRVSTRRTGGTNPHVARKLSSPSVRLCSDSITINIDECRNHTWNGRDASGCATAPSA